MQRASMLCHCVHRTLCARSLQAAEHKPLQIQRFFFLPPLTMIKSKPILLAFTSQSLLHSGRGGRLRNISITRKKESGREWEISGLWLVERRTNASPVSLTAAGAVGLMHSSLCRRRDTRTALEFPLGFHGPVDPAGGHYPLCFFSFLGFFFLCGGPLHDRKIWSASLSEGIVRTVDSVTLCLLLLSLLLCFVQLNGSNVFLVDNYKHCSQVFCEESVLETV